MEKADYMVALAPGVNLCGTKEAVQAAERLKARVKELEAKEGMISDEWKPWSGSKRTLWTPTAAAMT